MASSIKPATRYNNSNTNSLSSSVKSDPSSSAEFSSPSTRGGANSRAVVGKKTDANHVNFSLMVKKLVETKKVNKLDKVPKGFVIANDLLAEDLKKGGKKTVGLGGLHKKLFKAGSGKRGDEGSKKALTEVRSNTRTLAMVLRSERELLSLNKEQEELIAELKFLLEEKNTEVEKLKDLCLNQREEIKSLKSDVLFPDAMNSQVHDFLEKQGLELKHAKQLIPNLQRQVTSLTGKLQSLAQDLAEVKADKYSGRGFCDDDFNSPRTPSYDQEHASNFPFDQEYSSGDYTTPGSPDDMFLNDLNPCLTPYSKTKSKEFDLYGSPADGGPSPDTCGTKLSKSSECSQSSKACKAFVGRPASCSGGTRHKHGNQMQHSRLF
ncbi:uncharacterized protein LOC121775985 isoform X1 [Salvia splendens]|uniref:uncharacterized protein LOC121775985 isoform X1 n=1 Tax=Salvia splendens TaxID=180675 RepID=UPI001C255EA4|nr:uncharacterized protein LOC121775985 isoform X1 [Salvia splendens]